MVKNALGNFPVGRTIFYKRHQVGRETSGIELSVCKECQFKRIRWQLGQEQGQGQIWYLLSCLGSLIVQVNGGIVGRGEAAPGRGWYNKQKYLIISMFTQCYTLSLFLSSELLVKFYFVSILLYEVTLFCVRSVARVYNLTTS